MCITGLMHTIAGALDQAIVLIWSPTGKRALRPRLPWLAPRIERGTYVGFVADDKGIVIAGAGAVLLDWGPTRGEPSGTRARIVNVFTEHDRRGRGIAKALIDSVMVACAELGVRVFSLAASPDGASMYRSLGFVPYENEMILRR